MRTDEHGISLTKRQRECLGWVALGKTNCEIARIMGISHHTVHCHVEAAKARLDAATRTYAAYKAGQLGVLSPPASVSARAQTT